MTPATVRLLAGHFEVTLGSEVQIVPARQVVISGDRGFKLWRVVEQERVDLTRARPRYLRGAVSAGPDLEPQPGDHTDSILTVRCGERSAGERGLARLHRDAVSP